jgi:endonuclease YncB( thermonuclease family)
MKHFISFISIIVLCFSCNPKIEKKNIEQKSKNGDSIYDNLKTAFIKVVGITDGDTFKGLTPDNLEIKFRIYGIDSPEKKQAFGNKSKQYLSDLIFEKTVRVKLHRKDIYKRHIVWVFTEDSKDISAEMLRAGMAWHYKKYDSTQHYADLETKAHKEKTGLWIDLNPVAPWDFRKKKNPIMKKPPGNSVI